MSPGWMLMSPDCDAVLGGKLNDGDVMALASCGTNLPQQEYQQQLQLSQQQTQQHKQQQEDQVDRDTLLAPITPSLLMSMKKSEIAAMMSSTSNNNNNKSNNSNKNNKNNPSSNNFNNPSNGLMSSNLISDSTDSSCASCDSTDSSSSVNSVQSSPAMPPERASANGAKLPRPLAPARPQSSSSKQSLAQSGGLDAAATAASGSLLKSRKKGAKPVDATALLTKKSNYQNMIEGDAEALGLDDLSQSIEQKKISHKLAEQERRDAMKQCFDDLRVILPDIVDKNPSKVFLLQKSYDFILKLKEKEKESMEHIALLRSEIERLKANSNG